MIRLLPKHRVHVPNKLAVIAALILAVTSYAGMSGKDRSETGQAAAPAMETSAQVENSVTGRDLAPKKRKLNISALLFGNG